MSLRHLHDTIQSGQDALKRLALALDALQATAKASSQQDHFLTCIDAVTRDGGVFYEGVLDGMEALVHDYPVFLVSNCQLWYLELFLAFSEWESILAGVDCYGRAGVSNRQMLGRL